jgi:hypothetical protein
MATLTLTENTTAPVASVVGSGVISCASPSVTLTASPVVAGATYVFSGPGVVSQSGAQAIVNQASTYNVTITTANGCFDGATVRVTASLTTPNASLQASNGGVLTCTNPIITLTAGPNAGVSYRFSNGATQQGTGSTATVQTAGLYSVTVTNLNTGCTDVASLSISSNTGVPTVTLFAGGTLTCSQTSVALTANSVDATRYVFSGPGLSQSSNRSTASATQPGIYSVIVTSSTGCTALATTTVLANTSLPNATLVASASVITCITRTINLSASGGISYAFRGPGLNQNSSIATATVTRGGTYSVTVTGANGCVRVLAITIGEDNTSPVASVVGSGVISCASPSVTLTASPVVAGATYAFSGPGVVSQSGTRAIVNQAGTYSVTLITANGCSNVATVQVTATTTTPTATLAASNGGVLTCANPLLTLTAGPTTGVSYRFSNGATQQGTGNTATVRTAGLYSVTVTNLTSGCTNVASLTIGSNTASPTVTLSVSGPVTCSNQVVVLTAASVSQISNYAFSGPGLTQSSNRATANIRQPGTYTVVATGTNGCIGQATLVVAPPSLSISVAGNLTICTNQSTTLTASGGSSYVWSTGAATARLIIRPASTTALSVTATSGSCVGVKSVTVVVRNCSLARSVVENTDLPLSVRVLGNPTLNETVDVEIDGAAGEPLILSLTDSRGQQINQKVVEMATLTEQHTIRLGQQAGVYLLRVSTPTRAKTVKVVRQ